MRVFCFLILLLLLGAIGLFALQNREIVTVRYLDRGISCQLSVLVGIAYLLGMFSGWSVIGLIRRSIHEVADRPPQ